ncbi:ABC transporter ATP-binding protein [Conexibacter arvalis]|uniref:ABC-type polysaccharide/polyol phosphate transport system ATPase subunit n=1 Tax=Conexibacter arvalis TaxID=912552 RepID=A0A840IA85_9ACTN|nr:ABC transporter ATP-binding protein [Conexibacter arvalis]MBB4661522.1 ABC-type polysaccharide/polyol phosphate transport system ATPase subunit [Conexibacter arvalis]
MTSLTSHPSAAAAATATSAGPAVSVRDVRKAFRLPHQQYSTLKERVLHPFRTTTYDVLQAVDDVSFEVAEGEFFGIVGRNGSGKSTLLKCLAGIYDIDEGHLEVNGRLSPFIELGVGFNMDLTARDNVMINAIMLGLTRQQARERFDDIIAFAELEEFLDLKLKNYSSGMTVRLAFSVAIQVDAEVLLIDEVLAVGDAAFQQKCFAEFQRMKEAGRTILFVTHDMSAVERFCDRAVLLEKGRMIDLGEPAAIGRRYNELNFGRTVHQLPGDDEERFGDQEAQIVDAWFESRDGERIVEAAHGTPVRAVIEARFHADIDDPIFGFTLRNQVGTTIFATTTDLTHEPTGSFRAGETVVVRMEFQNMLVASEYRLTPSIARAGSGADALDLRADLATVVIHGGHFTGGVVNVPHEFTIERGG